MREELTGAEASFLSGARVAHLATLDTSGTPHVVPICPVLDLDRIVIASAYDRKVANIRGDSAVALCADEYNEDWDDGLRQVIVEGDAYLIESGTEPITKWRCVGWPSLPHLLFLGLLQGSQ